jgi:hypothetical protein
MTVHSAAATRVLTSSSLTTELSEVTETNSLTAWNLKADTPHTNHTLITGTGTMPEKQRNQFSANHKYKTSEELI